MATIFNNAKNNNLSAGQVISRAERLIRCAARYKGLAFGDYVRDVVVPLRHQGKKLVEANGISYDEWILSKEKIDFDDIKIWFNCPVEALRFIGELRGRTDLHIRSLSRCPAEKMEFCIFENDNYIMSICVVVASTLPSCTFSMDQLRWDGNITIFFNNYRENCERHSLENVLKDMEMKVTFIDPSYNPKNVPLIELQERNEYINRFLLDGWKIFHQEDGKQLTVVGVNQDSFNYAEEVSTSIDTPDLIKITDVKVNKESIFFTVPSACSFKIKVEIFSI